MVLAAALGRRLTDDAVPFALVTGGSLDPAAQRPIDLGQARFVVLAGALPVGRLPGPAPSRSHTGNDDGTATLVDVGEHEIRSTLAEVLTTTWIALRSTVRQLRQEDEPASIVVVIPASGPTGRASDGIAGIAAAGIDAMIRTLARELAGEAIAVNGVRAPSGTDPEAIADAVAALARATRGSSGRDTTPITGQILDVVPSRNAPTLPRADRGPTADRPAPGSAGAPRGTTEAGTPADRGRFAGQVALVTGAVRPPHMGRATALRLAAEGADVVIVDSPATGDPDADSDATATGALEDLVAEIQALGRRALAVPVKVLGADQASHLVDVIVHELGHLDVVCHLGGGTGPRLGTGPLVDITDEAWSTCLDANLLSPWFVASAAARRMRVQGTGGAIVLLSSYAVLDNPERYGAFCAARTGVVRLAEVLAQQCARDGVRVNTVLPLGVSPGSAPNPGLADLVRHQGAEASSWATDRIPMGRMQEAEETAAVFAFLASDDASFVSGQSIAVAGGAID